MNFKTCCGATRYNLSHNIENLKYTVYIQYSKKLCAAIKW